MATITSLGFSIFSTYSGVGVSSARRDLERLKGNLDKASNGFSAFKLGAVASAAALTGPLSVGILGAGAGLLTLGASAGAATGIIGLAFKAALKGTNDTSKQMHNLWLSLKGDLGIGKKAMSSFGNDVSPMLVEPFRIGVVTIMTHLHDLVGVVSVFRPLILQVATAFRSWANNNLQGWLGWINKNGLPILANLITMAKNLGRVFGDLLRAFSPMAVTMSSQLAIISARMKGWADGGGFVRFMDKVNANGPVIGQFLKNLASALANIAKALAGMGPGALALINPLLKLVAILPPPVIQAMVYAYIAWQVAMAGAAVAAAALSVALWAADAAATPFFLSLAIATAPLWLIVAVVVAIIAVLAGFVIGLIELAVHWDGFVHGMATAGIATWRALVVVWNATWTVMKASAFAIWTVIQVSFKVWLDVITTIVKVFAALFTGNWGALWRAVQALGQAIWNGILQIFHATIGRLPLDWQAIGNAFKTAWNAVWNAVKTAALAVWNALTTAWRAFFGVLSSVYGAFSGVIKSAWNGLWNAIKSVAQTIWGAISGGFKSFASGVQGTLSGLVSHAKTIWDGITNVFKAPINLVIGIWDKVAGVFHLPQIQKLAGGGHVTGPGGPTDDKIPAMLSNGEFVMNAAAVQRYGLGTMAAINAQRLATGGSPIPIPPVGGGTNGGPPVVPPGGTSGGGIPAPAGGGNNTTGGTSNPFPQGVGSDWVSSLYTKVKDLMGDAFMKFITPAIDAIAPPDVSPSGGIMSIPHAAFKLVEKSVLSLLKDASNIGGVIPAGQHKAIIDAALKAAGVPPPGNLAQWEAGLNTLITRESAWNSGAINKTDSNAQAGHPSQGLAQTIPSTFAAYHVAGTSNNILDPVANVAAAIRYIVARYGNITNVQQANANLPPAGYWRGTDRARQGWHRVGERGAEWVKFHGGEKVLPHGTDPDRDGHSRPVVVSVENHWHGNPDKQAVQYAESGMVDKIRQACHAGVGGGNY